MDGGSSPGYSPPPKCKGEGLVPQASPQAHVYTNRPRPGGYRPQGGATSAHAHLGDPHSPQAPTEGPSH